MQNLGDLALDIRRLIFKTVCETKSGHLASSLSSVEIMVTLYFADIMRYNPNNPLWEDRDRFILSKGHSALGLYTTLSKAGFLDRLDLKTFCSLGTKLGGLPLRGKVPGVEATTGSLGHGLSFAAGIAMNGKLNNKAYKVYTLLGDGELQEGEVWEAALFISQHRLDNLITIIDNNKIQATGYVKNIMGLDSLVDKWNAFGFEVYETNGHQISEIINILNTVVNQPGKPKVIIAHTVKGKGISYIENKEDWHYKMPTPQEIEVGINDLGLSREEYDLL